MKALRQVVWAVVMCLVALGAARSVCLAATPDEDMRPIQTGVTITGLVEEQYSDGLLIATDEGVTYVVLTPETISLEQEEAFHRRFKGKRVTLTGDVYKDEDGTLSLAVKTLPQ